MTSKQVIILVAATCGTLVLTGGVAIYKDFAYAPVLIAAGDIATCYGTGDEATAELLDADPDATVAALGDTVYPDGTDADFENCYKPSWGRHKARTYPAVGNHEYYTANASGYFDYFGTAAGDPTKGYYSYNLGDWHIVVLNGMCGEVGGCGSNSPMVTWLENDLVANPKTCTLAYWHNPLFSSGPHGDEGSKMKPTWDTLYAAGVELVLNGHDHIYERFAPQDPNGDPDPARGIREFVVGTGGAELYPVETTGKPNSEVRNNDTFGVLRLTLRSTTYDWEFIPAEGASFTDFGSGNCR